MGAARGVLSSAGPRFLPRRRDRRNGRRFHVLGRPRRGIWARGDDGLDRAVRRRPRLPGTLDRTEAVRSGASSDGGPRREDDPNPRRQEGLRPRLLPARGRIRERGPPGSRDEDPGRAAAREELQVNVEQTVLPKRFHDAVLHWQRHNFPDYGLLPDNWEKYFPNDPEFCLSAKLEVGLGDTIEIGDREGQARMTRPSEMGEEPARHLLAIHRAWPA